ncbi:MAG: HD domain-containing protein [Lachnospiraceae bacterium]|nr:HD domain-containing protein [Lachnospiraceae bacterium]
MAYSTFAAIDIGSFEISMKIYEVSQKKGMRQVDYIAHSIDLGTDSYTKGKIEQERLDELFGILREFRKIMKTYRVEEYKAYGTSAIRETVNRNILLSQIEQITGIKVEVLSNSEQRFLDYKSVAFQGAKFEKFIEKGTAIYDVGGGSVQISLFNKDNLISTQNMRLGVLRMQERMNKMGASMRQYDALIRELAQSQLSVYKKLYLKDKEIDNLIIVDDYISNIVAKERIDGPSDNVFGKETVERYLKMAREYGKEHIASKLSISESDIPPLYISLILLDEVMSTTGATTVWAPGVTLCDGIAYEYAESNNFLSSGHKFENDIISCAMQVSKRYMGSRKRSETLENIACRIFDATKEVHGLTPRDRLLLRLCAMLHDCGKYISMQNLAECSYGIIMSTEIIGISHKERMIIANAVKYNQLPFEYYEELSSHESIERNDHMRIAKLTAMLRLANGLDRSHKMKFKNVEVEIKNGNLNITVSTDEDIALEKGLFGNRADFFEEVFNLKPVIRQKRSF